MKQLSVVSCQQSAFSRQLSSARCSDFHLKIVIPTEDFSPSGGTCCSGWDSFTLVEQFKNPEVAADYAAKAQAFETFKQGLLGASDDNVLNQRAHHEMLKSAHQSPENMTSTTWKLLNSLSAVSLQRVNLRP